MSKNLEKEYKEYIQMETPDLWDRIEKELSRREQRADVECVQQGEVQSQGRRGLPQSTGQRKKRLRRV